MPLIRSLAAPGSPGRFLGHIPRVPPHRLAPFSLIGPPHSRTICFIYCGIRPGAPPVAPKPNARASDSIRWPSTKHPHRTRRYCSRDESPEGDADILLSMLGLDDGEAGSNAQAVKEAPLAKTGFRAQISGSKRKAKRPSQPGLVLESIQNGARDLYVISPRMRKDLAYASRTRKRIGGFPRPVRSPLPQGRPSQPQEGAATLHSILARHVHAATAAPGADLALDLTAQETALLHSQGYSTEDVRAWARCILDPNSVAAAAIFRSEHHFPPLFLVLLFLRRKRMKMFTLGVLMRHITTRKQFEPMTWSALKILVVRFLRHARIVWPESIPWVATLFSTEAKRIFEEARQKTRGPAKLLQDITHFSNTLLSLISLPTSARPVMNSTHQEKAQFQVLHFMQSCDPAIVVTRNGFRAVTRNQLMHSKNAQEREWATLKGPSWPPWKEARTAMDEEKAYEFGVSRASRVLHRMYEAGYGGHTWEDVAEIYAGWDTDMSPTIQTRTSLPHFSAQYRNKAWLKVMLWAGRIRTTRSKREAWACFLAYEASDTPASPQVYFAMFEKLHYPEVQWRDAAAQRDPHELEETEKKDLLPGDMKEVEPDPRSPLHLVHLSEPIPTYDQLFQRMTMKQIRPSRRFLAFLVETFPDFSATLKLLETHKEDFNGGVERLLRGQLPKEPPKCPVPGYFLGAFITFLCRFGSFSKVPATKPISIPPEDHEVRFKVEKHYLLEYAFALLMHCRPDYRPAWTTYMQKVLFTPYVAKASTLRRATQADSQYTIICTLLEELKAIDLDPDDEQFRLLCTVARYAAQAAFNGDLAVEDARHILSTAPRLLRTVFHTLVAANVDTNATNPVAAAIPPHVPDPAVLHTYVRALGMLRDYEGLYSFSTWATANHADITARANAQHSGWQTLYRTFLALRAALEGSLDGNQEGAPADLAALIREQFESVEEWGWPRDEHVDLYVKKLWRSLRAPRVAKER